MPLFSIFRYFRRSLRLIDWSLFIFCVLYCSDWCLPPYNLCTNLTPSRIILIFLQKSWMVHAGKYLKEDKLRIPLIQKLNKTLKQQTALNNKTKLPWFSRLLQHSARKRGGLFCNAPEPTRGVAIEISVCKVMLDRVWSMLFNRRSHPIRSCLSAERVAWISSKATSVSRHTCICC